jgi:hypothetical protein
MISLASRKPNPFKSTLFNNKNLCYSFVVILCVFLRLIGAAGALLFQSNPLYSRNKNTPSCAFRLILKSIYNLLKNIGVFLLFCNALHSIVLYGYLPCTVKPQRQNEIQDTYSLYENIFHTQNYYI